MKSWILALATATSALLGPNASAHRIDEYLQATLLSLHDGSVQASMRLIPGEQVAAGVIAAIDSDGDGELSPLEQKSYAQRVIGDLAVTVDGKPVLPQVASWSFPPPAQLRDGLGEIHLEYTIAVQQGQGIRSIVLANRHSGGQSVYLVNTLAPQDPGIQVLSQQRDARQSTYALEYRQAAGASPDGVVPWWDGLQLPSLFQLGMRHIAEGADHLLFLFALLLPAPLVASGSRWGQPVDLRRSCWNVLCIVTAFTAGHSVALAMATLQAMNVAGRPVEVLVALSILVSGAHAWRPLFPGKEALIAGLFGLIHGLAFASALAHLGGGVGARAAGLLAFNLGIESMQLLVVAVVLPLLLLFSRAPGYRFVRKAGACVAMAAAIGWIIERVWAVKMPVDGFIDAIAGHAHWIAALAFVASLALQLRSFQRKPLPSSADGGSAEHQACNRPAQKP
jgi:hypothetical protein